MQKPNDMNGMMDMMSKMMGGGGGAGMPMMGEMMAKMMPQGIAAALAQLDAKGRLDFARSMTATLVETGCKDLSEEEATAFRRALIETIEPGDQ